MIVARLPLVKMFPRKFVARAWTSLLNCRGNRDVRVMQGRASGITKSRGQDPYPACLLLAAVQIRPPVPPVIGPERPLPDRLGPAQFRVCNEHRGCRVGLTMKR